MKSAQNVTQSITSTGWLETQRCQPYTTGRRAKSCPIAICKGLISGVNQSNHYHTNPNILASNNANWNNVLTSTL